MKKTMQAVALLGGTCILLLVMEYMSTMRSITQQDEFKDATNKIKQNFGLTHVNIVRFQRPAEYRIILRSVAAIPTTDIPFRLEEIGRYFEKKYAPRPLTEKIRVVYMKEVGRGFSYKMEKFEKVLERKALSQIYLPKEESAKKIPKEK